MSRGSPLLAILALAACGGSHAAANARARQRIFSRESAANDKPTPPPIDIGALPTSAEMRDRVLGMTETELADRVRSFRLKGKLTLHFEGSGQQLTVTEDRLVEQSDTGDLHLRLLEGDGGGMEILWYDHKAYGRSRYGPYVLRDRLSGLSEQREEVFGALRTLYLDTERAFALTPAGTGPGGCHKFTVSAGAARPAEEPAKFTGRIDPDTAKRFQFLYDRKLASLRGEICVDENRAVSEANLTVIWKAGGPQGIGTVRAELSQTLTDVGGKVRLAPPDNPAPEPHRPRGPFATLSRFGFTEHPDGGAP